MIGVPDARMGEVGAAYVVVPQGRSLDSAELIAWARERMANYKVPRTVTVVEAAPAQRLGQGRQGRVALAGRSLSRAKAEPDRSSDSALV